MAPENEHSGTIKERENAVKPKMIATVYRLGKKWRLGFRARGDAARDRGDWSAAADAYESHVVTKPEDAPIWVQLGHAYKEMGNYLLALEAYDQAKELMGEDADLYLQLGHLHKKFGYIDIAVLSYTKSADIQAEFCAGAAMIALESILARRFWRSYGTSGCICPATLSDLVAAMEEAELNGQQLFHDYFHSFKLR